MIWRCLTISNKELQINEEIRDREVRVIGSDGNQLGVMPTAKALEMAFGQNLDLVKIAPQATPPVCKIIDYGKYRFEQTKREKEARKNQRVVEIKEIRLSLNIDTHDFETKDGHATRFLKEGNKVKVSIRFRGREMGHPEQGHEIMRRFAEALSEIANVEKPSKLEGRNMLMFLASKPAKIKTHSGAKKRFKLSKNGKVIRAHANKSHILNKKTTKRKRGLRQTTVADKTNVRQVKRLVPYK